MVRKSSAFYAVAIGRKPGVYEDWASAKEQIDAYKGARYKKFPTRNEAEAFVRNLGSPLLEQLARASGAPITAEVQIVPKDPMRDPHDPDTLVVFCDGSAIANGRKNAAAGYATVWPHHPELNAAAPLPPGTEHTNNRAEFSAFIAAMEAALRYDPSCARTLYVYTDSMLLINTATKWILSWKKNEWKKADGAPVANLDLVQRIYTLAYRNPKRRIVWKHVEAHTGRQNWESYWNDRVDVVAREQAGLIAHGIRM